jgi:hypothetical protein
MLKKFFVALNTHFIGIVGAATTVVGFAAQPALLPAIQAFVPAADRSQVSYGIMLAGAALAYFGKPKSVKPTDSQQVAIAEATGEPHPITPVGPSA